MNPSVTVLSHQEYMDGDIKEEVISVFGTELFDKTVGIIKSVKP